MLDYLENLRKKPEPERRKAVLVMSIGITIVIALVWGAFLGMRMNAGDFAIKSDPTKKGVPTIKETFSNIVDQISHIMDSATSTATDTAAK
ncbi:hypothetical protein KW799_01175 [Candidatus Parcubacteria bacterium]|nr:hypothetical protein [Candidatus Parcubacteria bacterium]